MESSKERNYGHLTVASKTVNRMFGDKSGRSVSMRTAHGLKYALNMDNLDEDLAEDIVHTAMVLTLPLISRKNNVASGIGTLLVAGLIILYRIGKKNE